MTQENSSIIVSNAATNSELGTLQDSYAHPDSEKLQLKHHYSEASFSKLNSVKPKQVNLDLSNVGIGLQKLQLKQRQEFKVNKLMQLNHASQ